MIIGRPEMILRTMAGLTIFTLCDLMKERATLKQIASELGVSISTVSKALNGSPEISEPTRNRIREYASLRHYRPNAIGLNLRQRSTRTIGVIVPNILNPFFAKVFSGIEQYAEAKGYNVLTCISNESLGREEHALEMLANGAIDGFILSVSEEAQKLGSFDHFEKILAEGTPIVMFDRVADSIKCDKVIVDDLESAVNATNRLAEIGCRKIALFSSIDNLSVGKLRAEGFLQAMRAKGLEVDDNLIVRTDNIDDFEDKALPILTHRLADGVFALDEHASVFAMKTGLQAGYKVPDELAIIGFADGLWSRRMTPSLSTVSQHGPEIGQAAAKLLIERLENKEEIPFKTVVINTELRNRDSTRR